MKYIYLSALIFITGCANYNPLHQSIDQGFEAAAQSYDTCQNKEETFDGGEYDPTNCRAQVLLQELNESDYPYMDLAENYALAMREIAQQLDCAEITPRNAKAAMDQAYTAWVKEEEHRCQIDTYAIKKRRNMLLDVRPLFDKRNFACYALKTN